MLSELELVIAESNLVRNSLWTNLRLLFLQASSEGNVCLVSAMLAAGADVNWKDSGDSMTGLHYAARHDDVELLQLLLDHPGLEVNSKNKNQETPLIIACNSYSTAAFELLLNSDDIKVNETDRYNQTVAHCAVEMNLPDCVEMLRKNSKVRWNIRDYSGKTPMMIAVNFDFVQIVQILLTLPGSRTGLDAIDNEGHNIAWLSVQRDIESDQFKCIQILSDDERIDWNTEDDLGDTPLLYCLKHKKIEFIKILISNPRVSLDVTDRHGKYPENIAR